MQTSLRTNDLAVGYNRNILLQDININLRHGHILTLIGPNGAGKSTILKTIARHLAPISGKVFYGDQTMSDIPRKAFAKKAAVVLTEQISPELMTCAETAAMGRYPYTDMFGKLTEHDRKIIRRSLEQVHALDLANHDFSTLSDGQKQRIMLARAICQEPEIIILDEPTAYLDIRSKIEILTILRKMARDQGITVIMSLHEIDLAMKVSDEVICLDGEKVSAYGTPEEILAAHQIEDLFDIRSGSYNSLFGSVELPKPEGDPKVFVIAGNGKGTPFFRALQKEGTAFAAGILFENDTDCQIADALSDHVCKAPAFGTISDDLVSKAEKIILKCNYVLDSGAPIGTTNRENAVLLEFAKKNGIPVLRNINRAD